MHALSHTHTHMALTWLNVRLMLRDLLPDANLRLDTSSEALEARGVTTNATKKAGIPLEALKLPTWRGECRVVSMS